jgi:hypothetical protein
VSGEWYKRGRQVSYRKFWEDMSDEDPFDLIAVWLLLFDDLKRRKR